MHYAMKTYAGVNVKIHVFFTSALVGGDLSVSRPSHLIPRKRAPGTDWTGGWVIARTDMDNVGKRKTLHLQELGLQPLGHPACSQLLCRLHYPSSLLYI
jgi:hypothetical protein